MLTVSLIFAAVTFGDDAAPTRFLLSRATLLRDSGCWFQWEDEVAANSAGSLVQLPGSVDASTINLERADGNDWRAMDFSVRPPAASNSKGGGGQSPHILSVTFPNEVKSAKLRIRAFSTAIKWRPSYTLELGKEARMSMRCLANAADAMDGDTTLECIASSGIPRGGETDYWSDSTVYPLTAKRLGRGATSLLLFDGPAEVEQFVAVELGGMAGEPGIKPARDRSVSMLRLSNRSTKSWPTGEMLVTNEGRLIARVTLPHTDAGQATEIALGAAVGIAVSRDEVELDRKTAVIRRETDPPDSIQTAGSATVSNHTGKAMIIRATKSVAGDATAASDDAKVVRTPNRLGMEQPLNEIRWNFTLPAGQSKRLTYGTMIRLTQPSEAKDLRP
jgi:hypothetical protein